MGYLRGEVWHDPRTRATRQLLVSRQLSMRKRTYTARGPVRGVLTEDGRQTIALLRRTDQTVNLVLVALTDGVEVEVYADGTLRRRLRFLRDTEARKYMDRVASRLVARGYSRERDTR
jgi:hypothetical protein